jgi:hypothetical protein
MSGAESLAAGSRIGTDVDNGAVSTSDYLRFTVHEPPVFDLDPDAMRDCLQLDIDRV